MAHPQANGEAKVANCIILQGLKTRLDKVKGWWVDELYYILWAYRTTQRTPMGETPFNLAFRTDAVISVEIGVPSARVMNFDELSNSERLRADLDLLEEIRQKVRIRMVAY